MIAVRRELKGNDDITNDSWHYTRSERLHLNMMSFRPLGFRPPPADPSRLLLFAFDAAVFALDGG